MEQISAESLTLALRDLVSTWLNHLGPDLLQSSRSVTSPTPKGPSELRPSPSLSQPAAVSRSQVKSSRIPSSIPVLPLRTVWEGTPFALEPWIGGRSLDSSLMVKIDLEPRHSVPDDFEARHLRDRWRYDSFRCDILVLHAPQNQDFAKRLSMALSRFVVPSCALSQNLFQDREMLRKSLCHPAVRLLIVDPETLAHPWIQTGLTTEASSSHWEGQPLLRLQPISVYENPSEKKQLWETLQAWKRL